MFRDAKIGDRVWDFIWHWGTIINISTGNDYPITVKFDSNNYIIAYKVNGIYASEDESPRLFWDEIKFKIPEKPFNLKEFLKENLEHKEFFNERSCDCIGIRGKNFKILTSEENVIGTVYFKTIEYEKIKKIEDALNENEVTPKQLKQAFKELGWI